MNSILHQIGINTANYFRLGFETAGNEGLIQFINEFSRIIARNPQCGSDQKLGNLLDEILSAQERGDYLCVADLLEYELMEFI